MQNAEKLMSLRMWRRCGGAFSQSFLASSVLRFRLAFLNRRPSAPTDARSAGKNFRVISPWACQWLVTVLHLPVVVWL